MNKVNIAVECEAEYRTSIYTLVTSIVLNENIHSVYCIYIILKNTNKELWDELSQLACENTEIVFWNDNIEKLENIHRNIEKKMTRLYAVTLESPW